MESYRYNTQYKVNYFSIYKDITSKMEQEDFTEEEFTEEDVVDICTKVYHDEICNVFNVESMYDDNIDHTMMVIMDHMSKNTEFTQITQQLRIVENIKYNIMSLFTFDLFHITHLCICEQLTQGFISPQLLEMLNQCILQHVI